MTPRSFHTALVLGVTLLALSLPGAALAAELRTGGAAVVASGETINDDLFATGETVTVAGRVTGDVYAAGASVVVTGTIDGDLIAAGQQVVVDGAVLGDVRAAGAAVTVNGRVGRSVTAAGQRVSLSSSGRVDGSLVAAGETITVLGPVGRSVTFGGGRLQMGGPVGGEVQAWARTLVLGPGTRVGGNLTYRSEREAEIPAGTVAGQVRFDPVERRPRREPLLNGLLDFGALVWLAGTAVLGSLAILLAPRASARIVETGRQRPLSTFGFGLLTLFGLPFAALLSGITLVGLPVGLVLVGLYALGLFLAWPALGLMVGTLVAGLARRERLPAIGALLVGLILLHLATHLPILGGLVGFLGVAFGLGLLVQGVLRWRRYGETEDMPAPLAPTAA